MRMENTRFLVPSGSAKAASRNGSVGSLQVTVGGQSSRPGGGWRRAKQRSS